MGKSSKKLLANKKYDTLTAQLVDRLDTDGAAALWARAERRLDGMLAQFAALPKGEKTHVEGYVLPTCAIYYELTDAFGKDEAFQMVDDFMAEYSANAAKAFRVIVALPGGRGFFMRVYGKVLARAFGEKQGFRNAMHECTLSRIVNDVLACPYQRTFAQLGAPELCQLFCRNDEICYGNLDGIRFVRTGTLAKGASRCDFLIERKPDEQYETQISDVRWWLYDIPGNIGWIIYLVCLIQLAAQGFCLFTGVAIVPAALMLIGIAELIGERIAKLDRVLPRKRLVRGFGCLTLGGALGAVVCTVGVVAGACGWQMLLGSVLCAVFAGLLYKGYKKVDGSRSV